MSKQQTAVEWFAEKVEQHLLTFGSIQPSVLALYKQEAKAIERERIMNAFIKSFNRIGVMNAVQKAEHYYNETYGGDK